MSAAEHIYLTLPTEQDITCALEAPNWNAWARLNDRDDYRIYNASGVRTRDNQVQINAGEYDYNKGYLNEEWVTPLFVYLKHQCDGCSYPPNMCCLQPSSFRGSGHYDRGGYLRDDAPSDEEIYDSTGYREAEEELFLTPLGVTIVERKL